MKASIHRRLSFATLILLVLFLGLTGLLLSSAQRQSLEVETRNRLLGHVYGLLGEAREDSAGIIVLPDRPADPRLSRPDSGLEAELMDQSGRIIWRSGSLLGRESTPLPLVSPGQQRFFRDQRGYQLLFGLEWESANASLRSYVLRIGLLATVADQQSQSFRQRLWAGLLLLGVLLLALQGLLLAWGLWPLRRITESLKAIEMGEAEGINGEYPLELQGLADNLNSLMRHNRLQQERFRNSLDDLAHSIKTPLALLQSALDGKQPNALAEAARQAVPHIDSIVRGRLKGAAASGSPGLGQQADLHALGHRLILTLEKVYREKGLLFSNRIPRGLVVSGDENDFMELFGNLLDNACKYADRTVIIAAALENDGIALQVEDDGPGIEPEMIEQVLSRGGRLDEQYPGQGIGLAAVKAIVHLYRGQLEIARSAELGGAVIVIKFKLRGKLTDSSN